jgi:hypothetical protein
MSLNDKAIADILSVLSNKFNDRFIITGSFADYCHVGYNDINDIDIYMTNTDFNLLHTKIYEPPKFIFVQKFIGIKKNLGNTLYKFIYKDYKIDITVIDPILYGWRYGNVRKNALDKTDISEIQINNKLYKIFSPIVRINQLASHNYTKKNPNYEDKVAKANLRTEKYEKLFGLSCS